MQRGMAALPDLHVSDSSEAMLSGRKPPFRLLVRAAHRDGRKVNIRHAVSEGFVVSPLSCPTSLASCVRHCHMQAELCRVVCMMSSNVNQIPYCFRCTCMVVLLLLPITHAAWTCFITPHVYAQHAASTGFGCMYQQALSRSPSVSRIRFRPQGKHRQQAGLPVRQVKAAKFF